MKLNPKYIDSHYAGKENEKPIVIKTCVKILCWKCGEARQKASDTDSKLKYFQMKNDIISFHCFFYFSCCFWFVTEFGSLLSKHDFSPFSLYWDVNDNLSCTRNVKKNTVYDGFYSFPIPFIRSCGLFAFDFQILRLCLHFVLIFSILSMFLYLMFIIKMIVYHWHLNS